LKSKFLIVIPARSGSKGIPRKNFEILDGKQVIDYSIEHAQKFVENCDVLISTDNFDFLANYSFNSRDKLKIEPKGTSNFVHLKRQKIILHERNIDHAQDNSLIMPMIKSILQELHYEGKSYIGVVLLQPTVPFRSNGDRLQLDRYLKHEASLDSSFITFRKVGDSHPARMYRKLDSINFESAQIYPRLQQARRQDLPELYLRDGCYYYIGTNLVMGEIQVGDKPTGYIRKFPWNINLDEEEDLIQARCSAQMVRRLLEQGV